MRSYNHITMVGNLTADPEQKNENGPVRFNIAVNDSYKNKNGDKVERVHFIPIETWNQTGKVVMDYCKKGKQILVAGKLMQHKWEDKETKKPRSMLIVEARDIQLLGRKGDDEGGDSPNQPASEEEAIDPHTGEPIDPDDIPF